MILPSIFLLNNISPEETWGAPVSILSQISILKLSKTWKQIDIRSHILQLFPINHSLKSQFSNTCTFELYLSGQCQSSLLLFSHISFFIFTYIYFLISSYFELNGFSNNFSSSSLSLNVVDYSIHSRHIRLGLNFW
jgi:hypothetical protein